MGAVGAAAPTIFSQWVQTMHHGPTILWIKNALFIIKSQKTSSFMNKFSKYSGEYQSKNYDKDPKSITASSPKVGENSPKVGEN